MLAVMSLSEPRLAQRRRPKHAPDFFWRSHGTSDASLAPSPLRAIREIADRIDGKPAQAVALAGNEEGEPLVVEIRKMVVDASGRLLGSELIEAKPNGDGSWDAPN